jgi:hypothetical protein
MVDTLEPPDLWELLAGAWTVDADLNGAPRSSATGLQFLATAVATEALSPVMLVEESQSFAIKVWAQQDDITAGNTLTITVYGYDEDGNATGSTVVYSSVLGAADNWRAINYVNAVTSGDRFWRIGLKKSANAFAVQWGSVGIREIQPSWLRQRLTTQVIPTATWTDVARSGVVLAGYTFNCETVTDTLITPYDTTQQVLADVMANVRILSIPNGRYAQLRVITSAGVAKLHGPKVYANGTENLNLSLAGRVASDTFGLQIFHNAGSDKDVSAPPASTGYETAWSGTVLV